MARGNDDAAADAVGTSVPGGHGRLDRRGPGAAGESASGAARARRLAAAVLLLALAACGVSPTPAPSALPSARGSAGPTITPAVTQTATPAPPAPSAGPVGPTTGPTPSASPSSPSTATLSGWPVYHGDAARTGLGAGFPAPASPSRAWSTALDGAVYGQPLLVGGLVIAATEGDSVYGLQPADGRVAWRRNVGTPVALSTLPCGNIDPLGITSTAAYDPVTDSVFVVAEVTGPRHVLFALDPASGAVRWSRGVDLAGDDPSTHQQRAALAVGNGYVYIGFGGLAGDCGQYRGEVVGVPLTGAGSTIAYRVPVEREGAVWATGGPVMDAAGNLYVSTGNGSSTSAYDGSDSVVELSPDLALQSRFAPSTWATDNAGDADLGSTSPTLVPGGWAFIAGQSGIGYVLRAGALGGIGGEVSSAPVCRAFGATARLGTTVYVPCTDGIRALQVDATGSIRLGWQTRSGADGPPVVGGGAAWSVDIATGTLVAIDAGSGTTLATIAVGAVPHFTSPTLADGLVLVGTMDGVVAVRASSHGG
jgi:outer membrane protein assembly factor BamB